MQARWVDNSSYFGPDRRRSAGRRWNERRHDDEAGDLPPLGALLRRLRLRVTNIRTDADREHAYRLFQAALAQADRLHQSDCAASLREAGRLIALADIRDQGQIARADALVLQAMAQAT